ncbi:MAG: flippase [Pacificibacter sp.]|uniref:flippase n=1 Tax=Pacificibacter sp. TaxID=1917866 RepID=UPI00321B5C62
MSKSNSTPNKRKSGLRAQLLHSGVAAIAVRAGAMIAGLIASVTLTRVLGPENYGVYAFVFSIITLLGIPVKMGLPTLILRETARADQAGDGALMIGVWRWSNRMMSMMAGGVLVLGWVFLLVFLDTDTPRTIALFWGLLLVPLIGWTEAHAAALRGLRHVALGTFPDKIARPILLTIVVVLLTLWHVKINAAQIYMIHAGVAVGTLVATNLVLRAVRPYQAKQETPRTHPRDWRRAIIPLAAIAGLNVISHNTDILMLGTLAGDKDVGLYRVALSGANVVTFGLATANLVLQPYFARAWGARDHSQLQKLAAAGARVSLAATLPVLALFWLSGPELLEWIFGQSYSDAFWPLILLCFGHTVSAFFGSVGNLLTMSGREWIALSGLAISTLVNVVLNWVLIPLYGIEGAAIATAISVMVWNLVLWVAALIIMRIDTSAIGLRRNAPEGAK